VYRARPCATRRSLTAATARLQSLRDSSTGPAPESAHRWADPGSGGGRVGSPRAQLRSRHPGRRPWTREPRRTSR